MQLWGVRLILTPDYCIMIIRLDLGPLHGTLGTTARPGSSG